MTMDKKSLSERDNCTKFITPAVKAAGWNVMSQVREEFTFTAGRIIVRGKLVSRGKGTWFRLQAAYDLARAMKRADRVKVERLSPAA